MVKEKGSPLDFIQKGASREYAWLFFINYTITAEISSEIKPSKFIKKGRNRNYYNWGFLFTRFKQWKGKGYFKTIKKLPKNPTKYNHSIDYFTFNLNPIFEFTEKNGVLFTPKQKKILEFLYSNFNIRREIFSKYKERDDFINAILKFYAGFFIETLKEERLYQNKELQKAVDKLRYTGLDFNKFDYEGEIKPLNKELLKHSKEAIYPILALAESGSLSIKDPKTFFYIIYEALHEKEKEVMKDLDKKILKCLGLSLD